LSDIQKTAQPSPIWPLGEARWQPPSSKFKTAITNPPRSTSRFFLPDPSPKPLRIQFPSGTLNSLMVSRYFIEKGLVMPIAAGVFLEK
jgi:hypothetical protein